MTDPGPYFDDLVHGQVFDDAPSVTLTSGYAATHRAILGDRLRLPLDRELCRAVTGSDSQVDPAAVWDLSIGQSTLVTRKVVANMFYRGLAFHRFPELGDTLSTRTEVVALRQNAGREGRRPTGLAALRIVTVDQADRVVLDYHRCAMLPLRDPAAQTGHKDELDGVGRQEQAWSDPTEDWRLDAAAPAGSIRFADLSVGQRFEAGADVVSSAPELARLTLNIAEVHHDSRAGGGRRLVYGGHTIGIAMGQLARRIPGVLGVTRWHSCDHVGPVLEGDTLRSTVEIVELRARESGGIATVRSLVTADARDDGEDTNVLDWLFDVVVH